MSSIATGPELANRVCRERLAPWLRTPEPSPAPESLLSWFGPGPFGVDRPGSEAVVQALSGLMHVHGQEAGRPRRLGLDVASVAAGLLAAQGALAARIGQARGMAVRRCETSVLQAGFLLAGHYIAEASSPDPWGPAVRGDGGPPALRSADGRYFELETFDPLVWRGFWQELGAERSVLGRAWTAHQHRYLKGFCLLPAELHTAAAATPWSRIAEVAAACGMSLSPLRGYREVLAEPGLWPGHPRLTPFRPETGATPEAGTVAPAPSAPELPLSGLHVVECTSRVQGPLAGLLLRMLGATVTWCEPPAGDASGMGNLLHRGKERVQLDLSRPAGRNELRELVADADVFLHNWRPGKAAEWGLGAETLSYDNSRLVYAEASGWGPVLDKPEMVGAEFMVQAYAGVASGLTPEGEQPNTSRVLMCDIAGALVACEGVLAGLLERERTGVGALMQSSLLSAAMTLQSDVLLDLATGREHGRRAGRPVWGPLDHPVETDDGWLVVSPDDEDAGRGLRQALGLHGGSDELLRRRLGSAPAAHWEKLASEAGVPAAEVSRDLSGLPADSRFSPFFEPLAEGGYAPAAPWSFH
ncbi:CoA transferase [Kitasatospora sp. NPDC101235]|uniref:CoA transferase n=1 Tax=Kitasatospora sp. NPDC101235 TaxID=3364101 RepID=UPI003802358D